MHRLTYVLRFHRPPADGPEEPPTTGPGAIVTTRLEAEGLRCELEQIDGLEATLDLTFAQPEDKSLFYESGTLTLGDEKKSSLTFSSIGAGTIDPPDEDGFCHGTVMYAIASGTGMFAGAGGRITSNFLVDVATSELIDTHLGVIRLSGP
jgi:hypothetical protein